MRRGAPVIITVYKNKTVNAQYQKEIKDKQQSRDTVLWSVVVNISRNKTLHTLGITARFQGRLKGQQGQRNPNLRNSSLPFCFSFSSSVPLNKSKLKEFHGKVLYFVLMLFYKRQLFIGKENSSSHTAIEICWMTLDQSFFLTLTYVIRLLLWR